MSGRSGADTVSALMECLQTHAPGVFDFPGDLAHPPDPVAWALDLFAANITQADMQSMEPGPGHQGPKLTYFDQRDPASFERFGLRIQNASRCTAALSWSTIAPAGALFGTMPIGHGRCSTTGSPQGSQDVIRWAVT